MLEVKQAAAEEVCRAKHAAMEEVVRTKQAATEEAMRAEVASSRAEMATRLLDTVTHGDYEKFYGEMDKVSALSISSRNFL